MAFSIKMVLNKNTLCQIRLVCKSLDLYSVFISELINFFFEISELEKSCTN